MRQLLFLFILLAVPALADQVHIKFQVDPPNAEVYGLGYANDSRNGEPRFLARAQDGWIADRDKLTADMRFLFRAPGYQDKVKTFELYNVMKNDIPEFELPLVELEPVAKNYFAYALVLAGVAASFGGLFYLRGRTRRMEDIGAWVQKNLVPSAEEDPLLGKRMGDFWLLQKLGRGGMATVYRAVKEGARDGDQYAVKVVHPHVTEGADFKTRFQREVMIGDQLTHPNIVTLFQAGEEDGHYYITLEFLDGGDLRSQIPEGGCDLEKVFDFAIPIFRAVAHAHKKDIVHRDLKPENVLVTKAGKLKLSDFGLARSQQFTTVTVTGSVMGTPGYIAPEQMTEGGPNPASDQYALGIMLFELATGRLPFEGDDPMQVLFKHIQEPPPAPSTVKPGLPPELDNIVLRMLAKQPSERYPSVDDAAAALESLKSTV